MKIMKKKVEILLLILFVVVLTGCRKNVDIENTSPKEDTVEKIDYEKQALNRSVNINTDSGDFGAGFVYDGIYIVTNYHVVYNAKVIKVVSYSRDEYEASLVGFNAENDIAVLKIDNELDSMILGDSDKVRIGAKVTAIGNSNGDLAFSKAEGKILDVDSELLNEIDKNRKYIWYDGDAVAGYSGGPVYDEVGETIGILNARYYGDLSKYDFDKLCAIIPINKAKTIIKEIIDDNQ